MKRILKSAGAAADAAKREERLRDRLERAAMNRTRPELMQFREMQFGAVAFVLAEAILGKTRAKFAHHHIARHFRDHARGGDAQAVAIAIDDRRLRQREGKDRQSIDERVIRRRAERGDRRAHRFVRGAQDVDLVDLDRVDDADRPADGGVIDQLPVDFFAALRQELLGIVEPFVPEFFRKDNGGGDYRAGQRASAGFINADEAGKADRAQSTFVAKTAAAHLRKCSHRFRRWHDCFERRRCANLCEVRLRRATIREPRSLPCPCDRAGN